MRGELVTKLTGRYLEFEMFPLSFGEYEEMKRTRFLRGMPKENKIYATHAGYLSVIWIESAEGTYSPNGRSDSRE